MASKKTKKTKAQKLRKTTKKAIKETAPHNGPKILLFDIESAPAVSYIWSLRQKYIPIEMLAENIFIMCWSAKWLHDDEIFTQALPMYKSVYKKSNKNDKNILIHLWNLLDEADMVVAHNAKNFDMPMVKGRFLLHGMHPPSPVKIIDTLSIARREFRFISNKLDWIAQYLKMGQKKRTNFDLWVRCMNGDKEAWDYMIEYNVEDVHLLQKVYLQLRPWDTRHPNVGLYVDANNPMCTVCASTNLKQKGYEYTLVGMYKRWKCKDCGHNCRGRYTQVPMEKRKLLLTNAV